MTLFKLQTKTLYIAHLRCCLPEVITLFGNVFIVHNEKIYLKNGLSASKYPTLKGYRQMFVYITNRA